MPRPRRPPASATASALPTGPTPTAAQLADQVMRELHFRLRDDETRARMPVKDLVLLLNALAGVEPDQTAAEASKAASYKAALLRELDGGADGGLDEAQQPERRLSPPGPPALALVPQPEPEPQQAQQPEPQQAQQPQQAHEAQQPQQPQPPHLLGSQPQQAQQPEPQQAQQPAARGRGRSAWADVVPQPQPVPTSAREADADPKVAAALASQSSLQSTASASRGRPLSSVPPRRGVG